MRDSSAESPVSMPENLARMPVPRRWVASKAARASRDAVSVLRNMIASSTFSGRCAIARWTGYSKEETFFGSFFQKERSF
jgi:hypothetical protein